MVWTAGVWTALVLSMGIGLSLGLVGGGGSIITVPVLVYVAELPAREAVAMSLAIVGATAAVGGALQWRAGYTHPRAAVVFGLTGMVGAAVGAQGTGLVTPPTLMLIFAALMLVVGYRMLRGASEVESPKAPECHPGKCGLAGLGVGVLTGFLGVGGGFLIVPALVRFAAMPIHLAVGTSLLVIAANSASGFVAHLQDLQSSPSLAAAFTSAALVGLFLGTTWGRRSRPAGLRAAFGWLALAVAGYLVVMNLGPFLRSLRAPSG